MTIDYNVTMTVLSIRFRRPGAYDRLKRRAHQGSESISAVGERLIDEGLRMEAHPGVVFRNGPTGRRAGLATGPDVWEIVGLLRDLRDSLEERVVGAAARMGLAASQVRTAGRYYAEFTDEIESEIAQNDEAAELELAVWENER
ncbi:hypothetical protein [Candidatus Poriferisodalis sp.]|uniref:hypothetical protein n=1 Tax=Candidatus Poriferisodalis sp. TaxID=3101277 RepID=UPI003B5292A9